MAGPKDVPVTWPVPQGTMASSPPWKEEQGSASNRKIKMRINIKIHTLFSLQNELVPVRLPNDVLRTCYTSSLQHSARCWMTTTEASTKDAVMTSNCCARSLALTGTFVVIMNMCGWLARQSCIHARLPSPLGIGWQSRLICVHT